MHCPNPAPLPPEKFHGAQVVYGVGLLKNGDGLSGCFVLAPGWYYSETGRARIAEAVDRWQGRIEEMQLRLDSMQARIESARPVQSPPHRCPTPTEHDAPAFATASVCLGLGFILGRLFPHRARVAP
jgi:hypothetical protein